MVCIATVQSEPEARLLQGILENEGIHSMLKPSLPNVDGYIYTIRMPPLFIQPFQLFVWASEAEKAKKLIIPCK